MQGYSFPFKAGDKLIELGGGDFPVVRPNVDCRQLPTVDIVADLEEPLPLESESYDGVFSKFVLEHLRIPRVRGFISEVHRILKPGGTAVIITANLLEQAKALIEREEWNDDLITMVFGGNPDYPENYHHSSMSPQYAIKLFREAGFHSITIYEWPPSKEIWGRATEMVIEARKSGARIERALCEGTGKVAPMDRISWIRSKAEGKVLDVGCAGGENFKGTRFEVIYTDINEFPLPNFICADAHHLPFNDNSFDSVVIGELLEHVTNPLQVLKEATRVSRKKVIFTVPNEFAWPVQLKPLMPLEERLKETGLTKEEQFKRDNPTCTKINDLSQAWHRRYYDRGMLQSQLNLIGLPYEVEELNYGGWSFWVGEIRKAPVIERAIRIKEVASSMEWADYQFLTEPDAFLITKQLYQIEQAIGRDVADSLHTTRRFEYPWVYINLQPFTKDDIVLDAGAGPTTLQFYLSRMVKEVHNVDIYPDWIEWVSKVKKEKSFPNLFPVLGDLTEMTFPSNHFDKAICISVLEHLPKDKVIAGIEELIRVTKPGGKIAITMDVVLEKTDKQTDLEDFGKIAEKYSFKIPDLPPHGMILRVPPYNFPFAVACILLEKGG